MFLLIDNSKNLDLAKMTPKIINVLNSNKEQFIVVNSILELDKFMKNNITIIGIILSGGPLCLSNGCDYNDIKKNIIVLNKYKNIPILGICFGFQIMSYFYGGKIAKLENKNKSIRKVNVNNSKLLLMKNLSNLNLFFSHSDYVSICPDNFEKFISNDLILGIENINLMRFGFQFHPEGTKEGQEIIINFLQYCKKIDK